jgi:hypothetical protein
MRRKRYIATIELVTVHRFTQEVLLEVSEVTNYTDNAYSQSDHFDWDHELLSETITKESIVLKSKS